MEYSLPNISSSENLTSEFQPPLHVNQLIIFSIFMLPCVIEGIFGNIFLICVLSCNNAFHSPPYQLMVSLACSDLLFLLTAPGVVTMTHLWQQVVNLELPPLASAPYYEICQFLGVVSAMAASALSLNMVVIAIHRYIMIVHYKFGSFFTNKSMALIIVATWLLSFGWVSPVLFGWGTVGYDRGLHLCKIIMNKSSPGFATFVNIRTPLVLISQIICYTAIIIKVRMSSKKIQPSGVPTTSAILVASTNDSAGNSTHASSDHKSRLTQSQTRRKKEINLLIQFGIVFIIYLCSWGLFVVVNMVIVYMKTSRIPYTPYIITFLQTINSAANPIVYLSFNRELRQISKKFILRCP